MSTVSGLPSASVALPASDVTFSAEQQTELATAQLGAQAIGAMLPEPASTGDVLAPFETVTPDYVLSLSPEWQMLSSGMTASEAQTDSLASLENDPASVYAPTADDGVTDQDVALVAPDDGGVSFLA